MSRRLTLRRLICEDLGYCCPYAFFTLFKSTSLIAARLGVTPRAVRYAKAQYVEGVCEKKELCLKKLLPRARALRLHSRVVSIETTERDPTLPTPPAPRRKVERG